MDEIIGFILQAILNCLFEILSLIPFEWPLYKSEKEAYNKTEGKCLLAVCTGYVLGLISLHVVPPAATMDASRIANLIISPFLMGFLTKIIAHIVRRKKAKVWPKRHFWYGFWLCLGYVLVRFMSIPRPH